ncbi:hypothetical protein O9853_06270 [Vibrio lentus]|nr:hypothetical protein [Vibrio lentus]
MPDAKSNKSGNVKKTVGISALASVAFFTVASSVILLTPLNAYLVWALTTIAIISTLIGFICYWVLIKRSAKSQQESFDKELIQKRKKAISKPFQAHDQRAKTQNSLNQPLRSTDLFTIESKPKQRQKHHYSNGLRSLQA